VGRCKAGWWLLCIASCALDERSPSASSVFSEQPASEQPAGELPSDMSVSSGAGDPSTVPDPAACPGAMGCPEGCSGEACCQPACGEWERCDEATRSCISTCSCETGLKSTCYVIHGSRGVCGPRILTCTEGGTWPALEACSPQMAETCLVNDVDEDCDGVVDEGCQCDIGDVSTCGDLMGALGVCAGRAMTCSAEGTWSDSTACEPQGLELCESSFVDENCDGRANESPPCDRFIQIDAESTHTCARAESGSAYCWGSNDSGQLGDGTTLDSSLPRRVAQFTGLRSLATGGGFGCAVLDDGSVQCWGDNSAQQLADGTQTSRLEPAPVPGLDSIFAVSAAGGRACALRTDSMAYCWGLHNPGASTGNGGSFVPVPLPVQIRQIATGAGSSCAIGADFRIYCWGTGLFNTPPPLGDGLNVPSEEPVLVDSIPSATVVDVAQASACAVRFGGAVQCWGANDEGQAGDGTTNYAPAPVSVPGIQATDVCVGGIHACAVLMDGTLRCWGSNSSGQLGDGTFESSLSPVAVTGLPARVNEVSCGFAHTCALLADSSTYCWGSNQGLALGNGSMDNDSRVPVQVHGP
jgi:alpha-tubulin suppressor-like RCC1 family protein